MRSNALIVLCITKNAIAADRVAVAFSFSAIPSATPIAKSIGKLSNTTVPTDDKSVNTEYKKVPGPIIPIRLRFQAL